MVVCGVNLDIRNREICVNKSVATDDVIRTVWTLVGSHLLVVTNRQGTVNAGFEHQLCGICEKHDRIRRAGPTLCLIGDQADWILEIKMDSVLQLGTRIRP